MAKVHVFVDEGGDMTFEPKPKGSRYFIIGSITLDTCGVGNELLALRRELLWQGFAQPQFYATNDSRWIRDRVFNLLTMSECRADVTIIDKPKTEDHLRADRLRFYKQAWLAYFANLAASAVTPKDELLVVAASLQVNRMKQAIHHVVRDVVRELSPTVRFCAAFWPAMSDPCLQVADYVVWAVQRKHEQGDTSFYDRISSKIAGEHQPLRDERRILY
jgi:Protein of unknown function (DUF3800)